MCLQVPFLIELFAAVIAPVWLLSCVNAHVHSETGTRREPLAANRAGFVFGSCRTSVVAMVTGRVGVIDISVNREGEWRVIVVVIIISSVEIWNERIENYVFVLMIYEAYSVLRSRFLVKKSEYKLYTTC